MTVILSFFENALWCKKTKYTLRARFSSYNQILPKINSPFLLHFDFLDFPHIWNSKCGI